MTNESGSWLDHYIMVWEGVVQVVFSPYGANAAALCAACVAVRYSEVEA